MIHLSQNLCLIQLGVLCRVEISSEYITSTTLGKGGSATVFRATHSETRQHTAIKVFTDDTSAGVQAAETEYHCAVRSAGPNTVEHYRPALMNGQPALVMELASASLHDWIQVCITVLHYDLHSMSYLKVCNTHHTIHFLCALHRASSSTPFCTVS